MDSTTWIGLGTLVTAVVGLGLVAWQLKQRQRALRAQFGNMYIGRYWLIDDDLLLEAKGTDRHRQHRHRYLRLFEDEFDVANLGFLDLQQWRAWHSVLDDARALDRVKDDFQVCDPAAGSFRRLRECVAQRERESGGHDVLNCDGRRAG